ncbi:histidine kinase [Catalinimonas sp. 4WD22]|uniref:histidine kinase n=1 Tax=Catalinimonas locisalis TaxID=3133978 RepID=UPI003100D477
MRNQPQEVFLLERNSAEQERLSLDSYGQYWVDTSSSFTIEQVIQQSKDFQEIKDLNWLDRWKLQFLRTPLWIHFTLENNTEVVQSYHMSLGLHDISEAYVFGEEQMIAHYHMGNLLPLHQRPVSVIWPFTNSNTMPLEILPGKKILIYAKILNPYGPNLEGKNNQYNAALIQPDFVEEKSIQHLLSSIFCQGALWFILIFHLVNFLINRTRVYLWYCLFLLAVILHMLDSDFFLLYLLPQHYPAFTDYVFMVGVGLVFISYFQFSKVVMISTQRAVWAEKIFTRLLYVQIVFFATWILIYTLNRFIFPDGILIGWVTIWHTLYQLLIVLEIVVVVILNALLIKEISSNVIRYYVAANTYMALVLALHFAMPYLLPQTIEASNYYLSLLANYSLETSILGQVLLFSIALAYVVKEKEQTMERAFASRLSEVEMQALRSQMNPHFLFNCLNSINRFVVSHQPAEASEYLSRFARLVRMILQNSQSPLVPLVEEIEAMRLYMDMEALRFEHRFTYEIKISKEVEIQYIEIPPMLLQPYLENAIWHGLLHKEEGNGHLILEITKQDDMLICTIEDNGIGREQAALLQKNKSAKRKSMGMKITSERLRLLERQRNIKAEVQIKDLVAADGSALGTQVNIRMSLHQLEQ